MRLGILSDAHGNADALKACVAHLQRRGVTDLVFLGDAVGYLPHGAQVLRLLESSGALCLLGNHEAMLTGDLPLPDRVEEIAGLRRFNVGLPQELLDSIRSRSPRQVLELAGKRLLLVHGSPDDPLRGRVHGPKDIRQLGDLDADAVVMGHTHRPLLHRPEHGPLLLNPGSCGLPRDHGSLLSLAILDLETLGAEVWRIPHRTRCEDQRIHADVIACLQRRCDDPLGTLQGNQQ